MNYVQTCEAAKPRGPTCVGRFFVGFAVVLVVAFFGRRALAECLASWA